MKVQKKLYYIKIKSHDNNIMKSTADLWFSVANFLKIERSELIYMPTRKSSVVLLRSPHVYKKSREKFQFIKYKSMFIIYDLESIDYTIRVKKFIELITQHLIPGISFQIIKIGCAKKDLNFQPIDS